MIYLITTILMWLALFMRPSVFPENGWLEIVFGLYIIINTWDVFRKLGERKEQNK